MGFALCIGGVVVGPPSTPTLVGVDAGAVNQ
jgi:hypothetical protein